MANKPDLTAYTVRDGGNENERGFWVRIGAAWKTQSGEGFTLQLDALPVNGRIVLMPPKADDAN